VLHREELTCASEGHSPPHAKIGKLMPEGSERLVCPETQV
jgi:hypothetical protein